MKKVIVMMLITALMATAILGGCGKKEDTKDGKVKLRFASWDSAQDIDTQQKLVDDYNASQDKVVVTLEAYGTDFDTKISAGMGSGDTPDIMYMWDYPSYYKGLESLDPYIEEEGSGFKEDYYEALWPYNSIKEEVYGMPVGFTTHCLYYNKDIFDKAGIEYPTSEWTWDDVAEASKTITEKVEGVKGYAFQGKADPYDFEMYYWSNGGQFIDEKGKLEGKLNSKEGIEAFEVFQNMVKDEAAIVTEKSGLDEIRSGKAAMFVYGSWGISNLEEDGLNFGIVEIPSFKSAEQKSVSILSSSGLAMSKDSKNKKEAWEFIKYWTGAELNKARIGYELPTLQSVVESEKVMDSEKQAPFYSMLERSSGYTPTSFKVEGWTKIKENLELSFERIFNTSSLEDAKKVLDEAAKEQE